MMPLVLQLSSLSSLTIYDYHHLSMMIKCPQILILRQMAKAVCTEYFLLLFYFSSFLTP